MAHNFAIVLYDIPSSHPHNAWSPNTLKTRYALNYKGLRYMTEWVEYPDIESVSKDIGAAPTDNKPDGRPHYTFPAIRDLSTEAVISDSTKIAAYLDRTYPDTPRLMPAHGFGLFRAFEDAVRPLLDPLFPFVLPPTQAILNPPSGAYFRHTREESYGMPLEALAPTGEAGAAADNFGKMDEWFRAGGEDGVYMMGNAVCYADMWLAAYVLWVKLVLPEKWEDIKTWHGGRWATLLENLEKYGTVV
ncbi:hypothetical protein GGX14DRAFT_643407 [Mycena pura]|uniref:GST N-terminal domain-containing protein n=1 Tax=Mycena pura TaxID=153505 RepID=A0AAD6YEY4_9AGAR|nr:hypothetical protein GGX14DRAFT_643407 [Mycena pura]